MESNLGMTELEELITRLGDRSKVRAQDWSARQAMSDSLSKDQPTVVSEGPAVCCAQRMS